jgi:hypothetical protein
MNRLESAKPRPPSNAAALDNLDWDYVCDVVAAIGLAVIVAQVKAPLDYSVYEWASFGKVMGQQLTDRHLGGFDSADWLHWRTEAAGMISFYFYCPRSGLAQALQLFNQTLAALKIERLVRFGHADTEARIWRTVSPGQASS